jgi:hypothetical protein
VCLALSLAWAGGAPPLAGQESQDGPERARPGARVPSTRADFDLLEIRDIFRYGDDPAPEPLLAPAGAPGRGEAVEVEEAPVETQARVRLVGLVRRADRLLAALSVDGEVLLLAEGRSAAGFTLLDVNDDGVRLRDSEGEETTLALP